jgi:hypothetical protein
MATNGLDDVGQKIGGARKDWRDQFMTPADVEDMTDAEVVTLVTKERAFPTPDWRQMREAGADPVALAALKNMRDALAAKPTLRQGVTAKQAAKLYIEECAFLAEKFQKIRTLDDVSKIPGEFMLRHRWGDAAQRANPLVAQAVFGLVRGTSRKHPINFSYREQRAAQALVATGWPNEVPAWLKGFEIQEFTAHRFLIKRGKISVGPFYESREAAEKALQDAYAAKKSKKAATGEKAVREPDRPHLATLGRRGPELLNGRNTTSETLLDTFGFRGIEFGEWLPDDERQAVLDLGYEALWDLAVILRIPPSAIGLGGSLAVAFGARGQGGAAAHYEPGRRVLNLTRLRGAGVLAHEYGHALDHWLGVLGSGQETEGGQPMYASGGRAAMRFVHRTEVLTRIPAIGKQFSELMRSMRRSPRSADEVATIQGKQKIQLERMLSERERELSSYREKVAAGKARPKSEKTVREWEREILGVRVALEALNSPTQKGVANTDKTSDFIGEASKLCGKSGDYWLRATELFARSFEAWVFDSLRDQGLRSDYLVHSVEADRYADPSEYKGNPYPVGDERLRINAAMEQTVELARAYILKAGPILDLALEPSQAPSAQWTTSPFLVK